MQIEERWRYILKLLAVKQIEVCTTIDHAACLLLRDNMHCDRVQEVQTASLTLAYLRILL